MKMWWVAAVLGLALAGTSAQTGTKATGTQEPAQAGALRLNSPRPNEQLAQDFVRVAYELTNRGVDAAPSPDFRLQLDNRSPVTTSSYSYTFTGLAPGAHTLSVSLVDANGMPIGNATVRTSFTVVQATPRPSSFWLELPKLNANSSAIALLPETSTPLPLLSLVGFAVLVGGICTAVRSR